MTLFVVAFTANAQGRVDGQNSVYAGFGFMPTQINNSTFAYRVKAGYVKLIGNSGFIAKADLGYSSYEVAYRDNLRLPFQRIHIDVMPGYSYEGLFPVMLNGFIGFYGAYEIINNGSRAIKNYSGEIPENINSFTTGFVGTAEIEVSIYQWLSVVVDFTQYYDLASKFSKGKYAIYGGLKFNF